MKGIKTYRVCASDFNNAEVVLKVDHSVLTEELAHEINSFFGDSRYRLLLEGGDAVRTVIRMFGRNVINFAWREGGWSFAVSDDPNGYAQDVIDWLQEGWPRAEELGISVVSALVENVSFMDVELEAA